MTDTQRLILRLEAYQRWRRGGDGEQPDPRQLGIDLDEAIRLLRFWTQGDNK